MPRRSTRNAILETAMEQFIERGFSACSVEDITKAASVPKGSFYNYFKSKRALAAEIVTEYGKGTTDRSVLTNPALAPLTRLERELWLGLAGIASVIFGVLPVARPAVGALMLLWLFAVYAIAFGAFLLMLAFRVRGHVKRIASALSH